ncbi:Serine/threonine-protein kinase A [Hyella patelloides LEGE 07179]|uniref:Serine/threonine-protein kinase A n=1 Tax=Hyella patelloides LEGE 07179 TaxID=945734 RepID=A0A563W2X7_9CYAN|nr:serine/threonine-protein kinase [Hyella patelloides]VEP18052.1 Serine/threonine-protein kinase A [Hyella patelloides LEGE 07179]
MSINRDPNYGRLLANRYQLAELVGEGAMGRVYRAKDTVLGGVTVAIKFLSHALLNKNMRDRFEREATISALLGEKSIHVVRVKDYGIDENKISFYVMEYLSGESLNDVVAHQPLALSRFFTLARHICLGLESAHQGISFNGDLCKIIHRDIKPSNIIIVQDPTVGEVAKILDFGIAKLILANASQTQSFMGTLAYCSPEQMEGKELDSRSDIYSLGVMMYEMLTTDMPIMPQNSSFGGWYQAHHDFKPTPFSSKLQIPAKLQDLVFSCLAKKREERPQSVREILQTLETLQQKPQSSKKPEVKIQPKPSKSSKPSKDRKSNQEQTLKATPSITEICLQASWPKDKPLKKIVFARFIESPLGEIPVLSVMLDYGDILNRMSGVRYNQFLFLNYPHPMLLWITLLYSQEHGPRWLPCYLDLKSEKGQRISHALAEKGSYRILFFALNQPERCQHVTKSTINPENCRMLNQWADTGKMNKYAGTPNSAKKILRQELEKLKPKILLKIQAVTTNYSNDISG